MANKKQSESDFPKLAKPALRALNGAGYTQLEHLTSATKTEISQLHGIGKNALNSLSVAMAQKG